MTEIKWSGRLGVESVEDVRGCCVDKIMQWSPRMLGSQTKCDYCENFLKAVRAGEIEQQEFSGLVNEHRLEDEGPDISVGALVFAKAKFPEETHVRVWLLDRGMEKHSISGEDQWAYFIDFEHLDPETVRHVWADAGVMARVGVAEKQVVTGRWSGVDVYTVDPGCRDAVRWVAASVSGTCRLDDDPWCGRRHLEGTTEMGRWSYP